MTGHVRRSPHSLGQALATALGALSLFALATAPGAKAISTPLPGPPPPSSCVTWPSQCLIQTRNGGFALSSHMVVAGKDLTGRVSNRCLYHNGTDPCPIDWSMMVPLGKIKHGCGTNDVTCTIKIPKNAPSSAYYVVNVGITSDQGEGWSSDYYAVVGRDQAVIDGRVLNKERQPVGGVEVAMYGGGHGTGNYEVVTAPDGYYQADVKRGTYRVWPSGKSLSRRLAPKFEPERTDVDAQPDHPGKADFTVDIGLVVKLTLSTASVPADGFQIVEGTITTTLLGRPDPNVSLALWPQPSETADAAVSTGTRATVCSNGSRVWPTGMLGSPDGIPADIQTDANGNYQFTLDVGTVPGSFEIEAWAKDSSGALITHDTADAADEQTLTVAPTGNQPLENFVASYNQVAKATNAAQSIGGDPGSIESTLATLSSTQDNTITNGMFHGYAYALVAGSLRGNAVVIYPAPSPPSVQSGGGVLADASDLVLQPGEWQDVPGAAVTGLSNVLQKGLLPPLPTVSAWNQGTISPPWAANEQSMTLYSQTFNYFGWPYPTSASGACS